MSGEPIRGGGRRRPLVPRRAGRPPGVDRAAPRPVLGLQHPRLGGAPALAAIGFGRRGLRVALPVLAVAVAYLPAVLLLTAALEPSELAERLIVGPGSPVLAFVTLRLAPGFGALAIAGAVTVGGATAWTWSPDLT